MQNFILTEEELDASVVIHDPNKGMFSKHFPDGLKIDFYNFHQTILDIVNSDCPEEIASSIVLYLTTREFVFSLRSSLSIKKLPCNDLFWNVRNIAYVTFIEILSEKDSINFFLRKAYLADVKFLNIPTFAIAESIIKNCQISNPNYKKIKLDRCYLNLSIIQSATIHILFLINLKIDSSYFKHLTVNNFSIKDTFFNGGSIFQCDISVEVWIDTFFKDVLCYDSSVSNGPITKSSFIDCSFNRVAFNHITFFDVNFKNAVFKNVTFDNVIFENCAFEEDTFETCKFEYCKFINCRGISTRMVDTTVDGHTTLPGFLRDLI